MAGLSLIPNLWFSQWRLTTKRKITVSASESRACIPTLLRTMRSAPLPHSASTLCIWIHCSNSKWPPALLCAARLSSKKLTDTSRNHIKLQHHHITQTTYLCTELPGYSSHLHTEFLFNCSSAIFWQMKQWFALLSCSIQHVYLLLHLSVLHFVFSVTAKGWGATGTKLSKSLPNHTPRHIALFCLL